MLDKRMMYVSFTSTVPTSMSVAISCHNHCSMAGQPSFGQLGMAAVI